MEAEDVQPKVEQADNDEFVTPDTANGSTASAPPAGQKPAAPSKAKPHGLDKDSPGGAKRRCVSTACIACRKRKSKVCAPRLSPVKHRATRHGLP